LRGRSGDRYIAEVNAALPLDDGVEKRASDSEREQAAAELREHYAAGRLDADELSSRLEAAYAARTQGELGRLRADLPELPQAPAATRASLARRRGELRRQLVQQTGGSLGVFAVCAGVWAASGAHGGFWPEWVLIFPGAFLLRNLWRLYGPAPELDRVEAELRRRRHGHRRRHRGGRERHGVPRDL
jgi:hypothetical protein